MKRDAKPFAWGRALLWFVVAYVLVTVFASGMTVVYAMVMRTPPAAPGASMLTDPAFVATVPFHVLVMLIVWPLFARLYFIGRAASMGETMLLALVWLVGAVIVDYAGFVAIDHPWALSPYEFYVLYQPWISLIYLAIFASPWIARAFISKRRAVTRAAPLS
jgi:hypothetical protein